MHPSRRRIPCLFAWPFVAAAIVDAAHADRRFRETVTDLDGLDADDDAGQPDPQTPRHEPEASVFTVVTGALEGVGATEVGIETAACLRARGDTCVLVDADLLAPTLAQRLQTPLTANLYAAIDAVTHRLIDLSRCSRWSTGAGSSCSPGSSIPSTGSTSTSRTCSPCSRRCWPAAST